MKRMLLVSLLGFTPACTLTGFGGDNSSPAKFAPSPRGAHRVLTSQQVGVLDNNGNVQSSTAGFQAGRHHDDHDHDADDAPNGGQIRSYILTLDPTDHGGFDSGYSFVGQSEAPEHHKWSVLTNETRDTNHDGFVSGGFTDACGINTLIDNTTGSIPPAALFADTTTCVKGTINANFIAGSSEDIGGGAQWYIRENENQERAYPNSAFDKLPFATRVDLMNSVNTQTDVQVANHSEVVHLAISALRVGDKVYTPTGASLDVVNMNNVRLDPKSVGLRLAFGWLADRAAEQLKAGQKSLSGTITLNGSVTVSLDQLGIGRNGSLRQGFVDSLRGFAGGRSPVTAPM